MTPRHLACIILCIAMQASGCAQEHTLNIEVTSNAALGEGEKIYITGNQEKLGEWNPSAVPLTENENVWKGTFSFSAGTHLEFKFTKGSWDAEALNGEARVLPNYQLSLVRDTTVRIVVPFWKDSLLNTTPEITGDYRVHEHFPVKGLDARRVIVWLPPSYASDLSKRYPVLYMHDGQNVFDPHTSTLGYDWRVDEIADSLIRREEIEEFICVASYCDGDVRRYEYSDDPDLGEKYQDFMCCQLKPWIDSVYRTMPSADYTAVMGSSMGGLISFILAWEYPDVFGKAACMSPAFKIGFGSDKIDYVEDVVADNSKKNIELYIDNGTRDLEARLQPGIDEMMHVLDVKHYTYTWYRDEGATHNEIAWSRRVWRPLIQFFGK